MIDIHRLFEAPHTFYVILQRSTHILCQFLKGTYPPLLTTSSAQDNPRLFRLTHARLAWIFHGFRNIRIAIFALYDVPRFFPGVGFGLVDPLEQVIELTCIVREISTKAGSVLQCHE